MADRDDDIVQINFRCTRAEREELRRQWDAVQSEYRWFSDWLRSAHELPKLETHHQFKHLDRLLNNDPPLQ